MKTITKISVSNQNRQVPPGASVGRIYPRGLIPAFFFPVPLMFRFSETKLQRNHRSLLLRYHDANPSGKSREKEGIQPQGPEGPSISQVSEQTLPLCTDQRRPAQSVPFFQRKTTQLLKLLISIFLIIRHQSIQVIDEILDLIKNTMMRIIS